MTKLFQFFKYTDKWKIRHVEIKLLGLKIRFPYKNWKAYKQKRQQRRREKRKARLEERLAALRAANQTYINQKKDKIIRRLFFTSGNLQLINALAIISQSSEENDITTENHVIVLSSITNKEFEKTNREMAVLCGIRHYHSCCGRNWDAIRIAKYIEKHQLVQIDEVYSIGLWPTTFTVYEWIYQNAKGIIMDEGVISLIPTNIKGMMQFCKEMFTTCFLGKLDYISFPNRPWTVKHIDQKHFSRIALKCATLYPCKLSHPGEKYVIFCGAYAAYWAPFTEEEMMSREEELIQKLIDKGYHVLYKPHPRDPVKRRERENFSILHTKLPLECYQLDEVYAVVSLRSCASLQSYHYSKVPGFIDAEFCSKTYDLPQAILLNDYTPPVDLLIGIDARHKSPKQLRREIMQCYESYTADKPLLSQNIKVTSAFLEFYSVGSIIENNHVNL